MKKLDPKKLFVEFRDGVSPTQPIIPRRYTLTHSDITAELFLTIGYQYAYDKINSMKDQVLGEWVFDNNQCYFNIYLDVDGNLGPRAAEIRNSIFRRELPLAIQAIRYGDKGLFETYAKLDDCPIIVYFLSSNTDLNKVENWCTFSKYDVTSSVVEA